jgi:hypothetical protein
MFRDVLTGHPRLLNLSARDHALINATMTAEIATALKSGDWTCHLCGIRLEGLMEIDHLRGHKRCGAKDVAPICQFCHDLKHPMWAMARKRAFAIYAPGTSQQDLTRMSWSLLGEVTREEGGSSFDGLMEAISERESYAFDLLQGENMESALEAILVIRDREGAERAKRVAQVLDEGLRYLPVCVRDGVPISRWTPEGFRPVPVDVLHRALGPAPDMERLSVAASELLSA